MLRAAIIEDNDRDAEYLQSHLRRYARENKLEIETRRYDNGILFLEQYRSEYDLVFMDIDMPAMNGMHVAKALRERDTHVLLIFVTALARFAVNGYEVDFDEAMSRGRMYFDYERHAHEEACNLFKNA